MRSRTSALILSAALLAATAAGATSSPSGLVGPSVGSTDLFISQGNKAYNDGKFTDARDAFLKAVRSNPASLATYLSLARAYMQTKDIALACYTYRVFVKNSAPGADHDKAAVEQEQCEKQRAALKPPAPDPAQGFVDQKAAFQEAVEANKLVGAGSASDVLKKMLVGGYSAPDLADMAAKLRAAAEKQAGDDYTKAISREMLDPVQLRTTEEMYNLARDVGATDERYLPRVHLLEGLAYLQEKKNADAEKEFKDAIGAGSDRDVKFYGAVAIYRGGDRRRAVKVLESELPDDPRTALFRTDSIIASDAKEGAAELQKMLFARSFARPQ
jgi:Tfp pilus assembly protein PilF